MRAFKWLLVNSLFAASLWFGLVQGIEGFRNIGLFIAWLTIVTSVFFFTDAAQKHLREKGPSVPLLIDWLFDAAITGLFVWHGYWVTAIFYVVHVILLNGARAKAKEEPRPSGVWYLDVAPKADAGEVSDVVDKIIAKWKAAPSKPEIVVIDGWLFGSPFLDRLKAAGVPVRPARLLKL